MMHNKLECNRQQTFNRIITVMACVFAPLLFWGAVPGFSEKGIWILSLFEYFVLFIGIAGLPIKMVSLYGFVMGTIYYGLAAYSFASYGSGTFLGVGIGYWGEILYGMCFYGLFCSLVSVFMKRTRHFWPVITALLAAVMSVIQESYWILTNPFFNPVCALWQTPLLIQTADIWGMEGITFVLVFIQGVIAKAVIDLVYRDESQKKVKTVYVMQVAAMVFASFVLIYGIVSMKKWGTNENKDPDLKIAVVQHNGINGRSEYADRNRRVFERLALEAAQEHPDVIVGSENIAFTPIPYIIKEKQFLTDKDLPEHALIYFNEKETYKNLSKTTGIPIICAGLDAQMEKGNLENNVMRNGKDNVYTKVCSYVFEKGEINTEKISYKEHLSPFSEKLPSFMGQLFGEGLLTEGEKKIFEINDVKIGPSMCFDIMFPEMAAELVKMDADLFLCMGSNYASRGTGYMMNQAALSVFRCVESRRALVRSFNSGVSGRVLPTGELDIMLPLQKTTYGIIPVSKENSLTFYSSHVLWFGELSVILLAFSLIYIIACSFKESKRKGYLYIAGLIGILYIIVSYALDAGIHTLFATVVFCLIPSVFTASIADKSLNKTSSLFFYILKTTVISILLCVAIVAVIGNIPANKMGRLPKDVSSTPIGVWKYKGSESFSRSSVAKDTEGTVTETAIFRENGEYNLYVEYRNKKDWMLDTRTEGSWAEKNGYININAMNIEADKDESYSGYLDIWTVEDMEYMCVYNEEGFWKAFSRPTKNKTEQSFEKDGIFTGTSADGKTLFILNTGSGQLMIKDEYGEINVDVGNEKNWHPIEQENKEIGEILFNGKDDCIYIRIRDVQTILKRK